MDSTSTDGEIFLARFSEGDILAQKLVSPRAKLQMLISRPRAGDALIPADSIPQPISD